MRARYDPQSDAVYVYVLEEAETFPGCVARSAVNDDGLVVDFLADGRVHGYDIMSVRHRGVDAYPSLPAPVRQLVERIIDDGSFTPC